MAIGIVGPQTCPNPKECNGKTGYPGGGLQVLINSLYLDKTMVLSTIKRHWKMMKISNQILSKIIIRSYSFN